MMLSKVSDDTAHAADLRLRHLGQRFAVATHREHKDDEILHATAEHSPRDNPERAGEIAKLGGQHGPD
jgi:hypothetical protein